MNGHLYVIGCGAGELSAAARAILDRADAVAGGRHYLERFASGCREKIPFGHDVKNLAAQLAARSERETVAVLTSGDPLFHGIGGTFRRLLPPERFTVLPACTAFQTLFARLGEPWSEARVFSIHGGKPLPCRRVLNTPLAALYCDNLRPAAQAAAALLRFHPESAERPAAMAENLGFEDERIVRGTLAELADLPCGGLSILALFPACRYPGLPLGRPDADYEHENNLITHPQVRAAALAALELRPGVMWDLGAGSGSVGLEAAGLCETLEVYAVEKNPARLEHIRLNAAQEGLPNHHAEAGNIDEVLGRLPDPDLIFIGGGVRETPELVERARNRLRPGGTLAAATVTLESAAALTAAAGTDPEHWQAVSLGIARTVPLNGLHLLKADNPITIFIYRKGSL